ncbi:MAG: hypothetical protein K8L91_24365 [Anaerolineae bacterium]|nr:hypothetical protein [Anaerolineae bacterium]
MKSNEFQFSEKCIARLLLGVGVLALISIVFGGLIFSLLWPLIIVVPGLPFLYFASIAEGKDRDNAWLAVPGGLITGTGLMMFAQNLTGHWESWAYAWTLYFVILGAAFVYAAPRNGDEDTATVGRYFIFFGTLGFMGLGLFFELFIFDTFGFVGKVMIAGLMIALGWWLMNREDLGQLDKPKRKNTLEDFEGNVAQFQQTSNQVRQKARVVAGNDGEIVSIEKQPK